MQKRSLKNIRIVFIIGTRAELIKCMPLMKELNKNKINYLFLHTGQHNLKDTCKRFSLSPPEIIIYPEPKKSSRFNANILKAILWNLSLVFRIRGLLRNMPNLKYVIYHGDTMTTASASIASSRILNFRKKYTNVHLEAGLRSGNIFEPFPEEIARKIADLFSDVLLVVSDRSKDNVRKYQNFKRIINVGNTIIDSVDIVKKMSLNKKTHFINKEKFALISIHRHENINNKKRLEKIVEILSCLKIKSYFPLYDNTRNKLEKFGLYEKLKNNKNIKIIPPVEYVDFVNMMEKCSLIVCDGGSLQEESLILNKPCIILRKSTERQEGLEANFQFLSNLDVEKTKRKIEEFLSPNFKIKGIKNPYGDIGVSKHIVEILR